MNLLLNLFKSLDFFGVKFQFSVMGADRFKSIIGFLLSAACIIMILVTSLLFGKDFYLKVNPRVVTENILTDIYIKKLILYPVS